jgi:hypothetical protein
MVFSFIRGGNRSTRRKLPTCRKSLTNFYHKMLYRVHLTMNGFELATLVVICTDCTCSCTSNYHTITTTTAPYLNVVNMEFRQCGIFVFNFIILIFCSLIKPVNKGQSPFNGRMSDFSSFLY